MPPRVTVGHKTQLNGEQWKWRIFAATWSEKIADAEITSFFVSLPPLNPCLPQTPREGDVILRRYTHWPYIPVVEWNPCAPTGGNTALDNWQWSGFEMLIKHNLPHSPPDCWLCMCRRRLWHREESLKGSSQWCDGTVSSGIRIQGHFSRDAHVKKDGGG